MVKCENKNIFDTKNTLKICTFSALRIQTNTETCLNVSLACRISRLNSMNSSSHGYNVSSAQSYRDSSSTAVAKNVIVVALGITINYINGVLIHTFRKHQVRMLLTTIAVIIKIIISSIISHYYY